MAKLVIGTDKTTGVPALIRDVSPRYYIEKTLDANGLLTQSSYLMDLSGIQDVGQYAFNNAYFYNNLINGDVDFSSLKKVTGYMACNSMFAGTHITSINLSNLTRVTAQSGCSGMVDTCNYMTSFKLDSLVIISGQNGCANIASSCQHLKTAEFASLKYIWAYGGCSGMLSNDFELTDVYFKALTTGSFNPQTSHHLNQFVNRITGCTIHFPKNLDPQTGSTVISSLDSYPDFGGTNTVLAFDQPSTVLLTGANSTVYERNPKYDTATALAWRVQDTGTPPVISINWTPYYTSTLNDPQVSDTIYSDESCTTAVTTISSIA